VEVDAFREDIRRDQDAIVVERGLEIGIEVGDDFAAQLGAGGGAEKENPMVYFILDPPDKIAGRVGKLGKDDQLPLG
jgi:hypothetical protein